MAIHLHFYLLRADNPTFTHTHTGVTHLCVIADVRPFSKIRLIFRHSAVTSTDNMKRHHSTAAILDSLWCCSAALLLRIKKPSRSFKETNCPSTSHTFIILAPDYLTLTSDQVKVEQ